MNSALVLSETSRRCIVGAALLALFLGAMDALIMSAAMPTIVADLGGMQLYAWAYASYMLARAVSLPIFGKLADRFSTKKLFMAAIAIFLVFSVLAGFSRSMGFLIASRVFQGIGAGGNFALVYIVLAEIAPTGKRGLYLSWASFVWGLASILGPTLGGVIISLLDWPWVFFINIPLGLLAALGITVFYTESRRKTVPSRIDLLGALTLSVAVVSLLLLFMLGGRGHTWLSPRLLLLAAAALAFSALFVMVEAKAVDPMLPLPFFARPGFRNGNSAVFFSAFAIFALFAYAPLYIQGALGKTPMHVGMSMLVLSTGWSIGAALVGQLVHRIGRKRSALIGALLLLAGCGGCLGLTAASRLAAVLVWFLLAGTGMGFVGVATMLKVQNAVSQADLGVATSSNQFARSLGGTIGVGICGGIVTAQLSSGIDRLAGSGGLAALTSEQMNRLTANLETLFEPQVIDRLPQAAQTVLHQAVSRGLTWSFAIIAAAALLCLITCALLPADRRGNP
ncbi:MAG: MFS transporter [Desulfosarcinaceae bacterium]